MQGIQHSTLSTILLLGVLQGAIMAVLLWNKSSNRTANRYLALAILAASLSVLRIWTHYVGLWWNPWFRRIPLAFDLAIGPLMYLYALSVTHVSSQKIRRISLSVLSPWAIFFLYSLVVYLVGLSANDFASKDALAEQWQFGPIKGIEDVLTVLMNLTLIYLMWQRLRVHYEQVGNWVSDKLAQRFRLLKLFSLVLLVLLILSTIDFVAGYGFGFGEEEHLWRQLFFVGVVIGIYILGFVGYNLPEVPDFKITETTRVEEISKTDETDAQFIQMESLMQKEQLYLNPDLSLQDLAEALQIPTTNASQIIRRHTKKNFRSYINDYRLQVVKEQLIQADYAHLSILAIALDAGFNSEASFYRYFKRETGLSPTQYRAAGADD